MTYVLQPHFNIMSGANRESRSTRRLKNSTNKKSPRFFSKKKTCPKLPQVGVSKNRGTPKSSILIGFSIINHPFRGATIFGNIQIGAIPMLFSVATDHQKPQTFQAVDRSSLQILSWGPQRSHAFSARKRVVCGKRWRPKKLVQDFFGVFFLQTLLKGLVT